MTLLQSVLGDDLMMKNEALKQILEQTILGTIDPSLINHAADALWERNDFVHHLPAAMIPTIHEGAPNVKRYGHKGPLKSQVLYGAPQEPGCVLVTAPPDTAGQTDFQGFHASPHAHSSAHIAIVTSGGGTFFVCKQTPAGPVVVNTPVRAGSMLFYPAWAEHTFRAGENGLVVASAQADYIEPDKENFAFQAQRDFNALPLVPYPLPEEYLDQQEELENEAETAAV